MKTIELYTVEWRDGYERHFEHDVSLDTMRSWFEDGGGTQEIKVGEQRFLLSGYKIYNKRT